MSKAMKLFVQVLIIFLAITGAASLLVNSGQVEFGRSDFWHHHGVFFLIFITIFPRLTLLFSSVAFGGFLWWLGFFFAPRLLIAILATVAYWQTNPVLVVIAWMVAISGETAEKWGFNRQVSIRVGGRSFGNFRPGPGPGPQHSQRPQQPLDGNVVDAEFRRMDD